MAVLALSAGCVEVSSRSADRFSRTGEMIALSGGGAGANAACFTCHGLDGGGDSAGAPRLAALDAGYLARQLEDYASGRRQHATMTWIARRLASGDRRSVAVHYAGMPAPTRPQGRVEDRSALYHQGDTARGLPSCASCHGARGEGMGPGNPPLAGQPAAYLADQISRWRKGMRRNDPGNVMQRISRRLSPQEAQALSDYAARLPGALPNPESPAASRAAHRVDPRSGA